VRVALALCDWPGASAERVEELITRRIEEKVAENVWVDKIESTSRVGQGFVYITLRDECKDTAKEFDDIKLRLDQIQGLPDGAGPLIFVKDFGSTAALFLTVASPKVGDVQVSLMAKTIGDAARAVRPEGTDAGGRVSIVACFPTSIGPGAVRRAVQLFMDVATRDGTLRDARLFEGSGFVGVDAASDLDLDRLRVYGREFIRTRLRQAEIHPDAWPPAYVRDLGTLEAELKAVAGNKYSYRELDEFTKLMKRTFQTIPQVTKVDRAGLLEERIYLTYSQERLAAYGLEPGRLRDAFSARNSPLPGGVLEIEGKNVAIDPKGEFESEREIGDMMVGSSSTGSPLYLRDLVDVTRTYESPPRFRGYYSWRDDAGRWQRSRAVTLAVQMRPGEKIGEFGEEIDAALERLKTQLPADLVFARTSDQPLQVEESIHLFMTSLYEAVLLVVLTALVGFWEWRSAALLALAIPLTLAMTFGMMSFLGVDLQQVSIASLIIALGLLVDDPVVAGDAIKRDLAAGHKRLVAAWLGPTKLATAILYATVTNIVAYLPFLLLSGSRGEFLRTLPIVLTCSLVASRIVSMTFVPLLGYSILRASKKPEVSIEERRTRGFAGWYTRAGGWAIRHRWQTLAGSVAFLVLGGFFGSQLKSQFFPKDLSYLFYIDVWLPEDAAASVTGEAAARVEEIVRDVTSHLGEEGHHGTGHPIRSVTTFVGGGGPRFWFSVSPEPKQQNYAQVILQVRDKHLTRHLIDPLQEALVAAIPGARINVRELESGPPVGIPVSIRISGEDLALIRAEAEKVKDVFRAIPTAERVQDDWGVDGFVLGLDVDADRANMAGVTNFDVAVSSAAAIDGWQVGELREGDRRIPVIGRLRAEERARLEDIENLYVYSTQSDRKVPLRQIGTFDLALQNQKILRRNQFRTITVSCFPTAGTLPSEVYAVAAGPLADVERGLPPGMKMGVGGEAEEQRESFAELGVVMMISILLIFLALVVQFKNAVKPFIVFAAIPYGMVGALGALWIMGAPFGFMAFLGVASLVGIIVSHVIVLFDFIEEAHERGAPLEQALLDAGILRLRPVLITVGATVFALVPLASHGGPLWEPLCYAQIGGLAVATLVTLLLVPVIYSIFVRDLKIVKWERGEG
jgi:multidrug efflux pump subunit AcrB